MSRMRGTPTLGPYSRTDSSPGRLSRFGVDVDGPRHAVDVEGQHHCAPGIAGPDSAHGPPPSRVETLHSRHSHCIPRHPRDGGNPGVEGMGSRLHGNDGRQRVPTVIPMPTQNSTSPSFPRRKTLAPSVIPAHGGNPGAAGMGSRLHGNDGRQRVPTVIPINPELHISVIPTQEDPCTIRHSRARRESRRRRGWVPVSTGTTGGSAYLPSFPCQPRTSHIRHSRAGRPLHNRHSHEQPSFPRRRESRGGGDGFPSPRERRAAARPYRHSRQTRTSHFRHSRAGRPLHNRHSRDGGNPGATGMGSRLHGDDGRHPVSATIPPPRREHTAHAPPHPCRGPCTTVIPATAGIQGWRGWVPVSTGTTGVTRLRRESTSQTRVYRIGVYENWKA